MPQTPLQFPTFHLTHTPIYSKATEPGLRSFLFSLLVFHAPPALISPMGSRMLMASAESGVYGDESCLELRLALSIGASMGAENQTTGGGSWEHFVSMASSEVSSSSSTSSSSSFTKAHAPSSYGIKRPLTRPVVGWPPVRAYRMSNLKHPTTEELLINKSGMATDTSLQAKAVAKASCFVKVTMDGIPIGRKMDINAHNSYSTLLHSVNEMFRPSAPAGSKGVRLLDAFPDSELVLAYKDKEGDWMLVGDVPWDMFINSVRRLRIMRRAEANGLE